MFSVRSTQFVHKQRVKERMREDERGAERVLEERTYLVRPQHIIETHSQMEPVTRLPRKYYTLLRSKWMRLGGGGIRAGVCVCVWMDTCQVGVSEGVDKIPDSCASPQQQQQAESS